MKIAFKKLLITLFICSFGLAFLPQQSHACSCSRRYIYLDTRSAYIPANAPGILLYINAVDFEAEGKDKIHIWDENNQSLEVIYTQYDTSRFWYVKPQGGFQVGKTYTFHNANPIYRYLKTDPTDPGQRLTVKIGPPLTGRSSFPLKLGKALVGYAPRAAGGSCSLDYRSNLYPIFPQLPSAYQLYQDYLHIETLIDGQPWKNNPSLCAFIWPGQSWLGKKRDIPYTYCKDNDPQQALGVPPGKHTVQMRVSLPHTPFEMLSEPQELMFKCPKYSTTEMNEGPYHLMKQMEKEEAEKTPYPPRR